MSSCKLASIHGKAGAHKFEVGLFRRFKDDSGCSRASPSDLLEIVWGRQGNGK